ncbi:MAG: hypothetical protein ACYC2P_03710 [Paludibacteraceae bacterium]
MKKLHAILTLMLLASGLFAQEDVIVISSPVSKGFSYVQNSEIQATEYDFQERIDEFKIDTASETAAVNLRGLTRNGKNLNNTGSFVLYDLKNQMPLWSKKINYQNEDTYMFGNVPILVKPNKIVRLDKTNGAEAWTSKTRIYFVDNKNRTGIGYKFGNLSITSDKLEGVDLANGATIWERDLDQTFGWNNIKQLNDSVVIITSTGLHSVNLKTGKGWDYKSPTGKKQVGEAIAKGIGSVALGVLTGVTILPNVDIVTGIASNTLVDSTGIYLAAVEKISRLNVNGDVLWSNELPKDKTSASLIFRENGNIYLMNKGYAYENGKMREYGRPFIGVYNEDTGKQVLFHVFDEKKLTLNDILIKNDTISLLFHNKLVQLSQSGDTVLAEKIFDTAKTGYLYGFANDKTYLQENDTFIPAGKAVSNYLLSTSAGSVLVLNDKLETIDELNKNTFYNLIQNGRTKLLYKDGSINVTNNGGKRLAEAKVSPNVRIIGKKLYESDDKVLRELDLSGVVEK